MGNICGKTESEPSQPGRPLGSAPPPGPKTSRVPQKVGGPPRTLGGAAGSGGSDAGGANSGDPSDARRKAAEAAEVRRAEPLSLPCPKFFFSFLKEFGSD